MGTENEPTPVGTDDAALFNDAVTTQPVEQTIEPEPPKSQEPPAPPEPMIPAPRFREVTEAKNAAERERDELRRRLDDFYARQQPQQKTEPPKRSDLFEAPSAFVQEEVKPLLDPLGERINRLNENWSRRFAEQVHGPEVVRTAYQALNSAMGQRDPEAWASYNRIMQSDDPYGDIVRWHSGKEVLSTVGTDLAAYRQKLSDELLKDPEFQKRAYEQWRGQAASNGNTVNRPVVPKLPSIGKVGAAAPSNEAEDNLSDEELFHAATRRR